MTIPTEYVTGVRVDAPAGLGGDFETAEVHLSPAVHDDVRAIDASLAVVAPDDSTLAELPMHFALESGGTRGAIFAARDGTGSLAVRLVMDARDREFRLTLNLRSDVSYYPHEIRPLVRLFSNFVQPNRLVLRAQSGVNMGSATSAPETPWMTKMFPAIVRDLCDIQDRAGMTRRIQPELTRADVAMIEQGGKLARGEAIVATWTDMKVGLGALNDEVRERMAAGPVPLTLVTPESRPILIQGVTYNLGHETVVSIPSARLSDDDQVRFRASAAGGVFTLVPGETDEVSISVR